MQVAVQVSEEVARVLQGKSGATTEVRALAERAQLLGVDLEPMHPSTDDDSLARFLTVTVPDQSTGQRVAAALRDCTGVEGAYLKPADEAP